MQDVCVGSSASGYGLKHCWPRALAVCWQQAQQTASPLLGHGVNSSLPPTAQLPVRRIKRQSRVRGLSLVDVNHPQHTTAAGLTPNKLSSALSAAGLAAGAVCLRFPAEEYALGAFSNPDPAVRAKAVQLSIEGCRWAAQLGARDLILWTQFDGYDYTFQVRYWFSEGRFLVFCTRGAVDPLPPCGLHGVPLGEQASQLVAGPAPYPHTCVQVDYVAAWERTVAALRQLAGACPPGIRVSLEPKPTDESTRWAIVPSTPAALLLARDVDRPNFGWVTGAGWGSQGPAG